MHARWIWRKGVLLLGVGLVVQGCTPALWHREFCEPAPDPHLKLFGVGNDVLVQYDEIREESGHLWRRNFFLNASTNAIARRRAPVFFDVSRRDVTNPIPLLIPPPTNRPLPAFFATSPYENGDPFFVVRDGKSFGPYDLPVYKYQRGTAGRVLLTPLAVAADAAALITLESLTADDDDKDSFEPPYQSPPKRKPPGEKK
jgi:hypothetical protein